MIVEIGGIRNRSWGQTDGHSTLQWPADAIVWSVDRNPTSVALTREMTAQNQNILCVLADGIAFLQRFPIPVDLLYLDGPDPDDDGRRWHLEAYQAATMNESSILLIDDTDLPRFGKGEFVIPAAVADGFVVIVGERQTLMVR